MWIMESRKRACGMVPRLGPAGFSLVMVCRGTGCTPADRNTDQPVRAGPWVSVVDLVRPQTFTALTQLLEADTGLQQDVTDVVDGPGVQLSKGDLQEHAVVGRDEIHVLQTVGQRFPVGGGQPTTNNSGIK